MLPAETAAKTGARQNLEATFQPGGAGRLCLGMAGNGDEDTAIWFRATIWSLKGLVDETILHLAKTSGEDCDTAEADRRARAICNLARAARAIVTLARSPEPAPQAQEDRMCDEQDHEELCPDAVERVRDDLRSRLGHLRSLVERKCLAAGLDRPDADGGYGLDPGPS